MKIYFRTWLGEPSNFFAFCLADAVSVLAAVAGSSIHAKLTSALRHIYMFRMTVTSTITSTVECRCTPIISMTKQYHVMYRLPVLNHCSEEHAEDHSTVHGLMNIKLHHTSTCNIGCWHLQGSTGCITNTQLHVVPYTTTLCGVANDTHMSNPAVVMNAAECCD